MKYRNEILVIVFSLLGAVVSAVMIEHHVHPVIDSEFLQAVCDTDGSSGCAAVSQSEAPPLFINGKKLQGGMPNDYFFEKLLTYEVQKRMGKN